MAWAGRLDHAELADLLPAAEAMAVTSTFPEAFGMVAAEAAACGALPVVANHSGLGEVARTLAEAVPPRRTRGSRSRSTDEAVPQLAAALSGWLAAPDDLRAATRAAIVEATRARYSWEGVAATVDRRRPGRPQRPARTGMTCQAAVARAIVARATAKAVTAVESANSSVSRPVETTQAATPR